VLSAFHPEFVTDHDQKKLGALAIAQTILAYTSKVEQRETVRTGKVSQRIMRTVSLGALAAALTISLHFGPGIYGWRQLAVTLAGFFFRRSLYANFKGR
jgi:hypothetical protein